MSALTKEKSIPVDKNNYVNITQQRKYNGQSPPRHNYKQKSLPKGGQPQINQSERVTRHEKINTSYTPITLIVHVLIIFQHLYTLYTTPMTRTWMRLASFTQLVYVTTTCFHIATLLANLFKKIQLERAFVLYGTWVIWIGWAMCVWLIRPENGPDSFLYRALTASGRGGGGQDYYINRNGSVIMYDLEYLLQPMDIAPFLMHGRWSTTTLPIISFFLLLFIRRNHWGLITWEHLVLLDYTRKIKWYRTWCVAGAGAGWMLTWEAAKFWLHFFGRGIALYRMDLPTFPGLFNVLWTSSVAGLFMVCWWSFWTFQYRGVIWKKEFKEGVAVWSSDGWMRASSIGC